MFLQEKQHVRKTCVREGENQAEGISRFLYGS